MADRWAAATACALATLLACGATFAQTRTLAGTWAASGDGVGNSVTAQTARNLFFTSVGGTGVQVQLSNVFGDRDVTFTNVTLGVQSSGASLVPGSVSAVTFNGQATVVVPKGQRVLSDVMPRTLAPQTNLAVSMYLPNATGPITGHPFGGENAYFSNANVDATSSTDGALFPNGIGYKAFVDAVFIKQADATGTIAALGDSITDGYEAGWGQSQRWTNRLATRLIDAGTPMGVMNEAIFSNLITADRPGGSGGPSALNRFERDVMAIPGLTTVIIFEGINDLTAGVSASTLKAALKTMVDRAHASGKCVVGGTILPTSLLNAARNADRLSVNDWIRNSGVFDGVIDFDAALRDPANPGRLLPAYNLDDLHPNSAGNKAMADAVDLNVLKCSGLTTTNLALGKTATQSSEALGGSAARAVDGSISGNWYDNSVTHSASAAQDWWQVDLGQLATIDSVKLWNRTDCCAARLSNFRVFVSATDMTGRTLAQLRADPAVKQVAVNSLNGSASLSLAMGGVTGNTTANTTGRYVRVQLDGQDYLHLAEVQVFGRFSTNLALGKTATQSSEALWAGASRAVDGNTSGIFSGGSVTHSAGAFQDWWQVDLGQSATIDNVMLWNRLDSCCAARLSNFHVFVSGTDMAGRTWAQLRADPAVTQVAVGSLGGRASLNLAMGSTTGRYVRVQLDGQDYLSLAEVQVYGRFASNLSQGKVASQSSTAFGGVAARAVDGSVDGGWYGNSVTHTDSNVQPWWQVDLGKLSSIDTVQLWNRTDCCSERLSNVFVLASPNDMTGKPLAQLLADPAVRQVPVASLNGSTTIGLALAGFNARYVRVQLNATGYLNLAEVQVIGR